jgi:hypothetical protein
LLAQFEVKSPDVRRIYELSSGYIHLSDHHIRHFLLRSAKIDEQSRLFAIGEEDSYMYSKSKSDLINALAVVTRGVTSIIKHWVDIREAHRTVEQLRLRFRDSA